VWEGIRGPHRSMMQARHRHTPVSGRAGGEDPADGVEVLEPVYVRAGRGDPGQADGPPRLQHLPGVGPGRARPGRVWVIYPAENGPLSRDFMAWFKPLTLLS
jgi:hypothetical protein